jgi:hypothetical protein
MSAVVLPEICDLRVHSDLLMQMQAALKEGRVKLYAGKVLKISTPICQLLATSRHCADMEKTPFQVIEASSDFCNALELLGLNPFSLVCEEKRS